MPQLLLELFSEEIPARMQAQAARDLARLVGERLEAAGLTPESLVTHAGPRRLTLVAEGVPLAQADRAEEVRGPRVGAPPQAMEGFLRKAGLSQDQLTERDGFWIAAIRTEGRPAPVMIAEIVEAVVRAFPWPKSMTWGSGALRWVRPLQRIVCLLGGEVIPFEIEGIASGDITEGHRFMGSRAPFRVRDFADYKAKLEADFVVLEADERRRRIVDGAAAACAAAGLELVPDEGLLDEVTGLAEWPTPILGRMDPRFLDLPPEVIRTSMRTHQKYFAVRAPGGQGLAPNFVVVANIEPKDGGAVIAAGNAKVLSARLSDARFFWDEDRKDGNFDRWLDKLKGVTFHAKLGTMADRVERIVALAVELAIPVGADADLVEQAARRAKADLASEMVGEFPELQGVMGRYYSLEPLPLRGEGPGVGALSGESSDGGANPHPQPFPPEGEGRRQIADAIRDHYRPQGPNDEVPTAPVSVAVALADKLDTLVGFFAIDEKPTGSKDPYALRRAALGVIRILLVSNARIPLRSRVAQHAIRNEINYSLSKHALDFHRTMTMNEHGFAIADDLLAFLADRLKVLLRDQGKRHDLVDAVFALGDDDLVRIVARVEALSVFLATDDGANLLAGYKRASNILRAEEKKGPLPQGAFEDPQDGPMEERLLAMSLHRLEKPLAAALEAEDFAKAMFELAELRAPVDAFFDKVLVNDPDVAVRDRRLKLLLAVRSAMNRVADFSLVGG